MAETKQDAQAEARELNAEEIAQLAALIKERTRMAAFHLVIDADRTPGLTDTKLGGLPYWPAAMAYPTTPKGQKLMLLAQLNLADFGGDNRLPAEGLLQFYIDATDDCSGMDFDDGTNAAGFRVVWHKTIDQTVTPAQVEALDLPTSLVGFDEDYLGNPLNGSFALKVEPCERWMDTTDERADEVFCKLATELFGPETMAGREDWYSLVGYQGSDTLFEALRQAEPSHLVLGYPFFTQSDPRMGELIDEFDTLLLQIDSDGEPGTGKDRVLWGDVGVGNFFINGEALRKGDFSRVLFNWDCY